MNYLADGLPMNYLADGLPMNYLADGLPMNYLADGLRAESLKLSKRTGSEELLLTILSSTVPRLPTTVIVMFIPSLYSLSILN